MDITELPIWDADNHYTHNMESFERHLDPKWINPDFPPQAWRRMEGADYQRPRPGQLHAMLRKIAADTDGPKGKAMPEIDENEWTDADAKKLDLAATNRDARLAYMDEQQIEAIMIFPEGTAILAENMLGVDSNTHNVEQVYAYLHSFNQWLQDDWGFNYKGRIFSPPLMSLIDLELAIKELDWALDQGTPAIHLRPGTPGGRSYGDPYFDPFWAKVNEANLLVTCHLGDSGYQERFYAGDTNFSEPTAADPEKRHGMAVSALMELMCHGDRPIMDTFASMILHNLFGRFPNIRVASIENGAYWVKYLLKIMDKSRALHRGAYAQGTWIGGALKEKPSNIFRQHCYVSPFWEENADELIELIGASQVLFGSDFPHGEGLEHPKDYFKLQLSNASDEVIKKVMVDNTRQLLGVG